ncbi:MFS transporter [Salmonella enterica]|nr:MFS transporter [Salmonella enterica]ELX2843784.1 MFS transporter [Salmonella enterica]
MKKILFLSIGMFALGLDAYVIAGILPAIGLTYGTSEAQNAQTVTAFTLCYAIAAPLFSALLAGKSVRKILSVALVIFAAANIGSALSPDLHTLLFFRAIAGTGAGLFSPVAAAAAAALVSPERKGRALSMILGGMSTGTVIGVPLGLLLSSHFGWQSTLWLVTIIGVVGLTGVVAGFPDITVSTPPSLSARFKMLGNRQVAATVGVTFLTALASLGLYTFIAPVLKEVSDVNAITPYLWAWGIGGMIASFSVGYVIDWCKKPAILLVFILLIMTLSLLSIPITSQYGPEFAFFSFILWGATGWSSLAPQQHSLLRMQPEHGAAVVALNSSSNYLGGAAGTICGGLLISYGIHASSLPYFAGAVAALALVSHLGILVSRRTGTRNTSFNN